MQKRAGLKRNRPTQCHSWCTELGGLRQNEFPLTQATVPCVLTLTVPETCFVWSISHSLLRSHGAAGSWGSHQPPQRWLTLRTWVQALWRLNLEAGCTSPAPCCSPYRVWKCGKDQTSPLLLHLSAVLCLAAAIQEGQEASAFDVLPQVFL